MTRRDFLVMLACYWIVFIALPGLVLLFAYFNGWRACHG